MMADGRQRETANDTDVSQKPGLSGVARDVLRVWRWTSEHKVMANIPTREHANFSLAKTSPVEFVYHGTGHLPGV